MHVAWDGEGTGEEGGWISVCIYTCIRREVGKVSFKSNNSATFQRQKRWKPRNSNQQFDVRML